MLLEKAVSGIVSMLDKGEEGFHRKKGEIDVGSGRVANVDELESEKDDESEGMDDASD